MQTQFQEAPPDGDNWGGLRFSVKLDYRPRVYCLVTLGKSVVLFSSLSS
jgi:hypothetical protein